MRTQNNSGRFDERRAVGTGTVVKGGGDADEPGRIPSVMPPGCRVRLGCEWSDSVAAALDVCNAVVPEGTIG
jgi:hypothetical protein